MRIGRWTLILALLVWAGCGRSSSTSGGGSTEVTQRETPPPSPPDATTPSTAGEPIPGKETVVAAPGTMPVKPALTPAHVEVQHILIGFVGSVPGKGITRTQEEARRLAYEVLTRARKGEDFDALVRQYTDDSPPGIYRMAATGVSHAPGEFQREGMVPAFGNVGFAISPGNIDIADYDPRLSPFGWHIIKRLK